MAQKIYAEGTLYAAGKQAKAKEDAAMIARRRRMMFVADISHPSREAHHSPINIFFIASWSEKSRFVPLALRKITR